MTNPLSPASEKENVPLKVSRVAGLQEDLKHSDAHSIPPTGPSAQPLKSILKSSKSFVVMLPLSTAPAEQATNNDPMTSIAYLNSPLETLLESIDDPESEHISLHDLTEAYNILSNRVRSQMRVIWEASQPLLAFNPLKQNSPQLTQSLRRDIRRALIDPSSNCRSSSLENSLLSNSQVSEDEIKYARDLSSLCHHTLRFLSLVFTVPAMYSIFPTSDLGSLLDDLLMIALSSSLPTPNARRTCSLIIWTLQVQRLPLDVLSPKKREISLVLKRAIEGEIGKPQSISDSLKAIHDLLKYHPAQFLTPLFDLLPSVLAHLISDSLDIRSQAAHALNGFVLAKMSTASTVGHLHDAISSQIRSFIDKQSAKRETVKSKSRLLRIITEAICLDNPSHSGEGPPWALVVLSSLIVLSDSLLFSHPRSLKLFFPPLAQALVHQRGAVRALHPHIWKCLVWAFSRISTVRPGGSAGADIVDNVKERAFLVVKQELRGGIGIALAASLIAPGGSETDADRTFDNVSKALTVVKEMVCANRQATQLDGLSIFTRLVSAIGTSSHMSKDSNWNQNIVLAQPLFDGTILHGKWENLSTRVRSMGQLKIDQVRQLSEAEIVRHWDALISIWVDVVERFLRGSTFQLSGDLPHIWQSLLLVQTQLTQGHGHLTTPLTFAGRIASIVSGILFPLEAADAQFRQLSFVQKLWTVMKNVFATSWLPAPAETILIAVLKRNFLLSRETVKAAWSQLCADLMSTGIPGLLDIISIQNQHQGQLIVQRKLWALCAKTWQASEDSLTWKEVASFLNIPLGSWDISDYEIELWDGMLRNAISSAGSVSVRPIAVIEHILQCLGEEKVKRLSSFPKEIVILLSHVDLSDQDTLPTEILYVINNVLYALYPPRPELLSTSLQFLRLVGDIIASAPSSLIVPVLAALSKSLCRWIADESEALLANEYNDIVLCLYCNPLNILRHQEPSLEMLYALSSFFASVFIHTIRPPALGPDAFEVFWRATYHGLDQFCKSYPESIKICLKGFAEACGGSLAAQLSSDTESQLTSSSIAPDSQPPRNRQATSPDYGSDLLLYPSSVDIIEGVDYTHGTELKEGAHSSPTVIQAKPSSLRQTPSDHSPTPRQSLIPETAPPRHLVALAQLKDYSSADDDNSGNICSEPQRESIWKDSHRNVRSHNHSSSTQWNEIPRGHDRPSSRLSNPAFIPPYQDTSEATGLPNNLKRPADIRGNESSKRRKIDPEMHSQRFHTKRGGSNDVQSVTNEKSSKVGQKSLSEPATRKASLILPKQASSQSTIPRKRNFVFDCVELPTYREVIMRHRHQLGTGEASPFSEHITSPCLSQSRTSSYEDYDSWEAGLSTEDMRCIQHELGCEGSDFSVPETDNGESPSAAASPRTGTEPLVEDSDILRSPFLGTCARQRDRSHTAPVPTRAPQPAPLRRNQTTSARLDVLERAYTVVTDDASQIPVQDLVQATRLVHEIGSALNEQMSRKLANGC